MELLGFGWRRQHGESGSQPLHQGKNLVERLSELREAAGLIERGETIEQPREGSQGLIDLEPRFDPVDEVAGQRVVLMRRERRLRQPR